MDEQDKYIQKHAEYESEDTYRWEIEFKEIIDSIYHELQGETEINGIWERDKDKVKRLNERGASIIKTNLTARINKGMALSRLDRTTISRICANYGTVLAMLLFDNDLSWELNPNDFSNRNDICNMITDQLEIMFNMAEQGGLRLHRQSSRVPIMMSQQQGQHQNGIY